MHGVVDVQCVPIIGINLWEHAYLQQYNGDKVAYTEAFFQCVQWALVSANFEFYNSLGKATPIAPDTWSNQLNDKVIRMAPNYKTKEES